MKPLPSLVFDLDGTLIDSVPDLMAAVNRMLAAEAEPPMGRAEIQSYVGDGAPVLVSRVMAARGIDTVRHGELTAGMVTDYTLRSAEETRIYPNVPETLERLRAAGHRLGICTNKPGGATKAVLEALGLAQHFECVVAGDTLAEKKPHPAPLLAVRDALGDACLYVGDSEVDAKTAEAADVPFLLFTEGYLRVPRDRLRIAGAFDDFRELPALVSQVFVPG